MGILDKVKSAVNFATGGPRKQTYGYSASFLNETKRDYAGKSKFGKIARFLTGGPRQQSYGYFAEHFQNGNTSVKREKKSFTPIRNVVSPTPGALPAPSMQYGASTESLNNVFDFIKRSQEKQARQIEVQNSFVEGRINVENERHQELLSAMKNFVKVKGGTTVTKVEENESGVGLFDNIKDMIKSMITSAVAAITDTFNTLKKGLQWLSEIQWLTKAKELYDIATKYGPMLLRFLGSPLGVALLGATTLAAFLKAVADEKASIEANPYDTKYKDNTYAKLLRKEVSSVAQGGEANTRMTVKQIPRPEIEQSVTSSLSDDELKAAYGQDRSGLAKWLQDNPKEKYYQAAVAPIAGKPTTGVLSGGNPLPVAPTALPEGVSPSTAGAARSSTDFSATDPRRLDLATPVPPAPISEPVSRVISDNKALEMQSMSASGSNSPVVLNGGSSQVVNDPPIATTAIQRDEEPMAGHVFDIQRKKSRAY
jgi:hypothetical protein